jgi:hypothetical protein
MPRRTLQDVAGSAEVDLQALVRDELRGPVSALVRQVVVELVHEQLNGHAPSLRSPAETAVPTRRPAPIPKPASE